MCDMIKSNKAFNHALNLIDSSIDEALDKSITKYGAPVTGRTHIDADPHPGIPSGYSHIQTDMGPLTGGTPLTSRKILSMPIDTGGF